MTGGASVTAGPGALAIPAPDAPHKFFMKFQKRFRAASAPPLRLAATLRSCSQTQREQKVRARFSGRWFERRERRERRKRRKRTREKGKANWEAGVGEVGSDLRHEGKGGGHP
eukprot:943633-Rhodomonas_salina.1